MVESFGIQPAGYRLPPAIALGPVRLQVADLDRSVDFYTRVLGCELLDYDAETAAVEPGERSMPTAELGVRGEGGWLIQLVETPGAQPVPRQGRPGLFHFALLLPDRGSLAEFVVHLEALDIGFGSADHLVSEAIYLQDPDNLGIEVYADRPREEWKTREGELVMATLPLYFGDLSKAKSTRSGSGWRGLPQGTTMGHVHLHVGELDRAARLYHSALGFDQTVWNYPGALFLSAGGYHHHLGFNTWAREPSPPGENDARLLDWTLILPSRSDVDEARSSVEAAGYETAHRSTGFELRDDWNTALRVVSRRRE